MPFFQTGNFGVLDLGAQAGFLSPPASTAKPGIASLPTDHFQGFVAVTPALLFDNHLWPRRGAWTDGPRHVPGPDENLLYAWDAQYAQNGYFAVASHVGVGTPRIMSAPLPDFVRNRADRFSLQRLGATFSADSVSWEEDGVTVSGGVGTVVQLQRGGGAISIITDGVIDGEFDAHLTEAVTGENGTRGRTSRPGPSRARCAASSSTRPGGTDPYLHRPRGVAIQPFVGIETPRHGDHVTGRQPVHVGWRDVRVDRIRMVLADPATVDEFGEATAIADRVIALTAEQLARRSLSILFGDLFPPASRPRPGRRTGSSARARVGTRCSRGRTSTSGSISLLRRHRPA